MSPRESQLLPGQSANGVHRLPGWPQPPLGVILHFAATGTAPYTREVLLKRGLSSHVVIERDRRVIDLVAANNRARHAGGGEWGGRFALKNRYLGIELVNFGDDAGRFEGTVPPNAFLFDWNKSRPNDPELLPHPLNQYYRDEPYRGRMVRVVGGQTMARGSSASGTTFDHRPAFQGRYWATYPNAQMDAWSEVLGDWIQRFQLPPEYLVGHEHTAAGRKLDPGPAFPWPAVFQFLKETYAAIPTLLNARYRSRDRMRALQSHLHRMGLPVGAIDGWWGPLTRAATQRALRQFSDFYGFDDLRARSNGATQLCQRFAAYPASGHDVVLPWRA